MTQGAARVKVGDPGYVREWAMRAGQPDPLSMEMSLSSGSAACACCFSPTLVRKTEPGSLLGHNEVTLPAASPPGASALSLEGALLSRSRAGPGFLPCPRRARPAHCAWVALRVSPERRRIPRGQETKPSPSKDRASDHGPLSP